MGNVKAVYETISVDPRKANELALASLKEARDQDHKDRLNWARAYALVEMRMYSEARLIWSDIFIRGGSHRALHQVGFVERNEGNLMKALSLFQEEQFMIDKSDTHAVGANLYELCYCHLLLGRVDCAWRYFWEYEALQFDTVDPIERGRFYRLKGELLAKSDIAAARSAYVKSREFFEQAGDVAGVKEMDQRALAI